MVWKCSKKHLFTTTTTAGQLLDVAVDDAASNQLDTNNHVWDRNNVEVNNAGTTVQTILFFTNFAWPEL